MVTHNQTHHMDDAAYAAYAAWHASWHSLILGDTEKFKEDEQDRIDMQAMQMTKWLDDRAKAQLLEHSKKEFEEIKASLNNMEIVQLEARWVEYLNHLALEPDGKKVFTEEDLNAVGLQRATFKQVVDIESFDPGFFAKHEVVNALFKPEVVNVQEAKPKVQSQVWQKQSGLRSTAPNFSAITSFTTRDNKPKLNDG